jgi:hypothetical protein
MMLELQQRVVEGGFYAWAFFNEVEGALSPRTCAAFFRNNGTSWFVDKAMVWVVNEKNRTSVTEQNDIAAFLLVRGPFAWLGNGWEGCPAAGPSPLPADVALDFGVPLGNLTEPLAGVFRREWEKATVEFDCNAYKSSFAWK